MQRRKNLAALVEGLEFRRLLATITVTSTADTVTPDDGAVTLREAITAINAGNDLSDPDITAQNPTATDAFGTNDTIKFNIPGTGVQTITPATSLPGITNTVTIDGYSQSGASANTLATGDNAVIQVELHGAASSGFDGLTFTTIFMGTTSSGSVVRGLAINGGFNNGITIRGPGSGGETTDITVAGCFIGTDAAGDAADGTLAEGIEIDGTSTSEGNTIGTPAVADRNVISGAGDNDIFIIQSADNVVQNNYIGFNAAGTVHLDTLAALDEENGVSVDGGSNNSGYNTIGGAAVADRNVMAATEDAVSVDDSADDTISGNFIGVDADGVTQPLDELNGTYLSDNGVRVGASSSTLIGGNIAAQGNVIANAQIGVKVEDPDESNVLIRYNSIFSNASESISLSPDGSVNDPGDTDTGANGLQNFAVIGSATESSAGTHLSGILNTNANQQYVIDFFASPDDSNPTTGQAKTWIGSTIVTTDANGNATFTVDAAAAATGSYITNTVSTLGTYPYGDTSQVSPAVVLTGVATPPPTPILPTISIGDVSMNEGDSGTTAFTFTITRSGDLSSGSSVKFATEDESATVADHDYQPQSNTIGFDPNQATKTVTILVNGDTKHESNETFTVNLSSASGATIANGVATGTILNDDPSAPPPPASGTVTVVTDPIDPSKTSLDIVGTPNADTITVTKSGLSQGKAVVKINGVNKGTFSFTGIILVYGNAGSDNISIDTGITRSAWIWGGDGSDTVNGGGGNDMIFGQAGNDSLNGNAGRDILIGGDGTDKLSGGGGDDVLIAGDFKSTPTMSQLSSIQKEWTRTDKAYVYRVNHLTTGGGYNTIKLNSGTLFSSTTLKDSLTGGADSDLFFAAMTGDKITDKASGETAVNIG